MTENTAGNKPVDIAAVVKNAIEIMKDLATVMYREVDVLAKRQMEEMQNVRQEKARLIRDYRSSMGLLIENRLAIKTLPEDEKGRLQAVANDLSVATKENVSKLKVAINATQTLVSTIINTARRETRRTECYTDPRNQARKTKREEESCDPVAFCQTI